MFASLRNLFRVKDIRKKLFFTLLMICVIRFGSQLPVPGVDREYFTSWFSAYSNDAFNFFSAFTGGSFENMSIFALGITPYITSSIIIQLLSIAIPALEELHKDGEDGRKKLTAITRYTTAGLALLEAVAMTVGFGRSGLLEEYNILNAVTAVVTLVAGSMLLVWIGERITEKGVGNGISIVLMVNILSSVPSDFTSLYGLFIQGKSIARGLLSGCVIAAVVLATVILVIFLNDGERRIPVQYAKKVIGRKQIGGQSTHIPLKVNTAGVLPVIFTSSLFSIPSMVISFAGITVSGMAETVVNMLSQSNWFNASHPEYSIGLIAYILLIVFFAYFYTSITFNPVEVADNMKKQGGFIPGIRPGGPTAEYLNKILGKLILIGAAGLIFVVLIPVFFSGAFGASVSFGGTSIIIIVGVVLETIKQLESQMVVRNYRGFLTE